MLLALGLVTASAAAVKLLQQGLPRRSRSIVLVLHLSFVLGEICANAAWVVQDIVDLLPCCLCLATLISSSLPIHWAKGPSFDAVANLVMMFVKLLSPWVARCYRGRHSAMLQAEDNGFRNAHCEVSSSSKAGFVEEILLCSSILE